MFYGWLNHRYFKENPGTNDDRAHDAMQKADTKAREKQERAAQMHLVSYGFHRC